MAGERERIETMCPHCGTVQGIPVESVQVALLTMGLDLCTEAERKVLDACAGLVIAGDNIRYTVDRSNALDELAEAELARRGGAEPEARDIDWAAKQIVAAARAANCSVEYDLKLLKDGLECARRGNGNEDG
jgi:hypothetical protein